MMWPPFERTGLQVVSNAIDSNTLADDLLNITKLHLRVEQNVEDTLITDYINGAIDAAENYLQKDIYPRTYELLWTGGPVLRLDVGNLRDLAITVGDPAVDDMPNVTVRGDTDFRGAGLIVYRRWGGLWYVDPTLPDAAALGKTVTFGSGFEDVADLPGAVKSFIYAMVGMLYENREIVNVGPRKYAVEEIPVFLLDALKTQVIA
jgi:hypothetical protein